MLETEKSTDWDAYFFAIAAVVSTKSKDLSTKVGCVIVSESKQILATGFNGFPRGVLDVKKRMQRPEKYNWTAHAEENCIAHAARNGVRLEGSIAYVTHTPCANCTRLLIQAGVKKVMCGPGKTKMDSKQFEVATKMFAESGVQIHGAEIDPPRD